MSAEIQLAPLNERGIKLLDQLEAKTGLLPFKTDAQGGRAYALQTGDPGGNSTGCSTVSAPTGARTCRGPHRGRAPPRAQRRGLSAVWLTCPSGSCNPGERVGAPCG
jgi:hypothetical protein